MTIISLFVVPINGININCETSDVDEWKLGILHTCFVNDSLMKMFPFIDAVGRGEITSVNGKTTPTSYEHLKFSKQSFKAFPKRLGEFFPKLKVLKLEYSGLELIEQEDLKQFTDLRSLYLMNNKIETLGDGLFDYNPHLWNINFSDNEVKHVGTDILGSLDKLEFACFNRNKCVNLDYNQWPNSSGRSTLETALNRDCKPRKQPKISNERIVELERELLSSKEKLEAANKKVSNLELRISIIQKSKTIN